MTKPAAPAENTSFALGWLGRQLRQAIEGPLGALKQFLSLDHNVIDLLHKTAVEDSARYIAGAMKMALAMRSREAIWSYALRTANRDGLWLEFGVFKGYSINFFARTAGTHIYGFDSFRGLQEDWKGTSLPQGAFDLAGRLPRTRPNVTLLPGWFNDTLPGFLAAHDQNIALLHLDCDTCEATAYVLSQIRGRLTQRSILILDDYHGFWGFRDGQFKAWAEFVKTHDLTYSYAAFNRHAVLIRDIAARTA
jgi:hypothetical protein